MDDDIHALNHFLIEQALSGIEIPVWGAILKDAQRWRDAENAGHVVEIRENDYSIQHPPSCRPNLIDCRFHVLMQRGRIFNGQKKAPGRYRARLVWPNDEVQLELIED